MNSFSTLNSLFFNHIGQIKWQWRGLAFFVVYYLVAALGLRLVQWALPATNEVGFRPETTRAIEYSVLAILGLVVTWGLLRVLDRRPIQSAGLCFHSEWLREFSMGLVLGVLFPVVVILALWAAGLGEWEVRRISLGDAALGLVINLVMWASMAVYHEVIWRGYLLQTISEGLGKIAGTFFMSFWYGVLAPSVDFVSWLNMFMIGLVMSIAYFRSVSLWLPLGLHSAWYVIQGYVWGSPVQGTTSVLSLGSYSPAGSEWITGGAYGPEGGMVATAVILLLVFYISQSKQIRITDTMRKIKYAALTTPFVRIGRPEGE